MKLVQEIRGLLDAAAGPKIDTAKKGIIIHAKPEFNEALATYQSELPELFNVSQVELVRSDENSVKIVESRLRYCERCRKHTRNEGDALCERCANAVNF